MSTGTLAVTYPDFTANTTIVSGQVDQNNADIVNYVNNRDTGVDEWQNVRVTGTNVNPVVITSNQATTMVSIDNTASDGDPQVTFKLSGTAAWTIGVDDSDSDKLKFSNAADMSVPYLVINSAATPQLFLDSAAAQTGFRINNTAVDGDPALLFALSGSDVWYIAVDDSDSDKIKIGLNSTVGANVALAIDGSGNTTPGGSGTQNFGDGTNYWADISYKTLTDRGCLPWCDDGVELQDGTIVSDLEALSKIEKHPTKITVQGLPMLDYKTFPKKAYKLADKGGVILERDKDDEPVGGQDGVEMTMMFGVMIGAFKELKNRVEALEKA